MKLILSFLLMVCISASANCQASYVERIPACPVTVSSDAVNTFLQQLSALKDECQLKATQFKNENEVAAKNIDPNAVIAAYGGGADMAKIQEMQRRNQEIIDSQNKLTEMQNRAKNMLDNIRAEFEKDMAPFLEKRTQYINKCIGEVGSNSGCEGLSSELNTLGNAILVKYWFAEAAQYKNYLAFIRSDLGPLAILCSKQALESAEFNAGITVPHKEDLVYIQWAIDLIVFIQDAYSIDSRLWPLT